MKRILRWAVVSIFAALMSPFIAFGIYAVTVYVPVIDEINEKIEKTDPENKNAPEFVKDLIKVSVNANSKPSWSVARALVTEYIPVTIHFPASNKRS